MDSSTEERGPEAPEIPDADITDGVKQYPTWTPDLGADIGSRRWFFSLFVLIGLIASASALGWYALRGPDTEDLMAAASNDTGAV